MNSDNDLDFAQYSENSVHFFSRRVPSLLSRVLQRIGLEATLVDVGCGDGHLIWALSNAGHLPKKRRVFGVDISSIRLRRFSTLTGYPGIIADGQNIPTLETGSVDLTISTMVIEHVPDDFAYTGELARITRRGGFLYLSTVIRKRGAWYFRKAPDGRRVLDPTHLREYPSEDAVLNLIVANGFVVTEKRVSRLFFPIAHPLVRWLNAWRPLSDVQRFFLRPSCSWLEVLALPIPRYRSIEIVARRTGAFPEETEKSNGPKSDGH